MTDEGERRRPSFEIGLLVVIVALVAGYAAFARERGRAKKEHVVCASNLQKIGLAAMQYADDKRFFPHLTKLSQLDGDHTSDTSALAMNLLVKFNYLSDPSVFVCPGSRDHAPALAPERVALTAATDLSYGWTRKGIAPNCQCLHMIAGDKARFVTEEDSTHRGSMRGNHADCMQVVMSDGRVERIKPDGDSINTRNIANTTMAAPSGFLGVLPD